MFSAESKHSLWCLETLYIVFHINLEALMGHILVFTNYWIGVQLKIETTFIVFQNTYFSVSWRCWNTIICNAVTKFGVWIHQWEHPFWVLIHLFRVLGVSTKIYLVYQNTSCGTQCGVLSTLVLIYSWQILIRHE